MSLSSILNVSNGETPHHVTTIHIVKHGGGSIVLSLSLDLFLQAET